METSEKKLGCLAGTLRFNTTRCGDIEGSVNTTLKTGCKAVSIKDGKVLFWIVNDYDVTVTADDIASYSISSQNKKNREKSRNVNNERIYMYEHTVNYDVEFKNGTNGCLKLITLTVCAPEKNYNEINKMIFRNNKCPNDYVPEVAGWLTADGTKDDKYNDVLCPDGYKADIVGFRKVSGLRKVNHDVINVAKLLNLAETPLTQTVNFGGEDLLFVRI